MILNFLSLCTTQKEHLMLRRFALLSLVVTSLVLTGCLGSGEDDILGTWRRVEVNPDYPGVELTFFPDGAVMYYEPFTNTTDSGRYEMSASIDHRFLELFYLDKTPSAVYPMSANYVIHRLDEDVLTISTNRFAGGGSDRANIQYEFLRVN